MLKVLSPSPGVCVVTGACVDTGALVDAGAWVDAGVWETTGACVDTGAWETTGVCVVAADVEEVVFFLMKLHEVAGRRRAITKRMDISAAK